MSWFLEGRARSALDAILCVRQHREKNSNHFPQHAADSLVSQIASLPQICPAEIIYFKAQGHASPEQTHASGHSHAYARSELVVEILSLVEPAPIGEAHS